MKCGVAEASWWKPERGALSAHDGMGALSRFARTCASLVERVDIPRPGTPIVVGTATGTNVAPSALAMELEARWNGVLVSFVQSHDAVLATSFMTAALRLSTCEAVDWAIVDLTPGAELAAAFRLNRRSTGRMIELRRRTREAPKTSNLNPCAPILDLEPTSGAKSVSIGVGWWSLELRDEV